MLAPKKANELCFAVPSVDARAVFSQRALNRSPVAHVLTFQSPATEGKPTVNSQTRIFRDMGENTIAFLSLRLLGILSGAAGSGMLQSPFTDARPFS